MVLCVASIGVQISASVAQNIRPVSGVISVTTAPVQVTYQDITGEHIGRKADTGDPIFLNDVIMTGADVTMQVMLKDQTVFTMGPDSSIRFDTFIYDPADGANGSLSAQVLNGSFKFISGKIADNNPDGMVLKLSHTTAAIRGTSVAGRVNADGSATLILLSGAVSLQRNDVPDAAVTDIFRSGWGVTITETGSASDPFRFEETDIANITAELTPEEINKAKTANKDEKPDENPDKNPDEKTEANQETKNNKDNPSEADVILATLGKKADENEDGKIDKAERKDAAKAIIAAKIEDVETETDAFGLLKVALADDGKKIDVTTLGEILTEDKKLLQFTDLTTEQLKPDENTGVVLESDLLDLSVSGAIPIWMTYSTSPAPGLGNPGLDSAYADLISDQYAGTAQFSGNGLELSPVTGAGSGKLSYSIDLDYDGLKISGSYQIEQIDLGGNPYQDYSDQFDADLTSGQIYKTNSFTENDLPAILEDENGNALLDADEVLDDLVLGKIGKINPVSDQLKSVAQVYMNGSFGSLTDGKTAFDGSFGKIGVTIKEIDENSAPVFTDNHITASHISEADTP
ncbi:FecR family protein [Alphaproteobacteria bacterium]|nr:FecR family protein [Alphaproteobacteria bacterium]